MTIQKMEEILTKSVVLIGCGSFNPVTTAHLRMMEVAKDKVKSLSWSTLEGVFSPVSSTYNQKKCLQPDEHRFAMLKEATKSSSWMRVSDWEMKRGKWSRTIEVLEHHAKAAAEKFDCPVQCLLVCGGDLVDSFNRITPSGERLWDMEDIRCIVEKHGLIVQTRPGSKPFETLEKLGVDTTNCFVVDDSVMPNDASSTRIRQAIGEGRSIRYSTPDAVVEYIDLHGLYRQQPKNE